MAAHEGSEHAEQAERHDFGDATLEQLHADVVRLSAELMTGDPFAMFMEMRRIRDRVYRLLEGHLRPGDQADLYFLAGCVSDLMAVPASGLGYPQAAEELIRAGWANWPRRSSAARRRHETWMSGSKSSAATA